MQTELTLDMAMSGADPVAAGLVLSKDDVCTLARRHPLYAGYDLDVESFERLPILNKADLTLALRSYFQREEHLRGLYLSTSGGSYATERMYFPVGINDNRLQRRWLGRILAEIGLIPPQAIALNLFPGGQSYRALEIFNDFGEQAGASMISLERRADNADVIAAAQKLRANMVMGEPGRLTELGQALRSRGEKLPLLRILYAGEALRAAQRRIVCEAFLCDRLVSIYGSAETGIWAWHLDTDAEGVMHFDPRMIHLEILDPDEEGIGIVVVTNLLRRRVPVLRYRTGDRARWILRGESRASFQLIGREPSSFTFDGNYHDLPEFESVFEEVPQYQLHLSFDETLGHDVLEVRYVPPAHWHEPDRARLDSRIREIVVEPQDPVASVRCRPVAFSELQRSPTSGKIPRLIDHRIA